MKKWFVCCGVTRCDVDDSFGVLSLLACDCADSEMVLTFDGVRTV